MMKTLPFAFAMMMLMGTACARNPTTLVPKMVRLMQICEQAPPDVTMAACAEVLALPQPLNLSVSGDLSFTGEKAVAALQLGSLLGRMNRHEEAIAAYRHVFTLELKPSAEIVRALAYSNMSLSLGRLGAFEDGLSAAREGVRLKPDTPWPWMALGILLNANERYEESAEAFEKAFSLDRTVYDNRPSFRGVWEASREGRRDQIFFPSPTR